MRLAWVLVLALASGPALAHKPSDSYLSLELEGIELRGRWDIALRDLEYALALDANGDGAITWGEVRQRHPRREYARRGAFARAGDAGVPACGRGLANGC